MELFVDVPEAEHIASEKCEVIFARSRLALGLI